MERRQFLKNLGLAAASLALPGCNSMAQKASSRGQSRQPNIVFIIVDDLGWVDTGCYGSKYYETPNIDHLAAEGMRFTNAYAACAVCSPTRAAVMTGRYPARTGITDWIHWRHFEGDPTDANQSHRTEYVGDESNKLLCPPNPYWMDRKEVTVAERLKSAGYTTCHIGKWHLGPDAWYPEHQGFDYNIGGCDYGQPPTYFDPYRRESNTPNIPTLEPREPGEYLTDREADEATDFIKEHKDEPFFLYMAHYAVHTPIEAKDELIRKYKNKPKYGQKNATYAAMIDNVDQAVGKILDTLDDHNLTRDTVVFFTSDNGGFSRYTNNAPLREGKGYPYEGGIREPLIIRWPGVVKPNIISDEVVTSVDYLPTICDIVGIPLPAGPKIDGVSLARHLRSNGKAQLGRDAVYWHFPHYRHGNLIVPYSIIRCGDYKLIKRYEGKEFELFNLAQDLSEKNDLSDQMPQKVKELNAKLTAWLRETGAKLPRPNPDFDPDTRK